jgi:hypothetical protein
MRMMDETGGLRFSYWKCYECRRGAEETRLTVDSESRTSPSNATPGFRVVRPAGRVHLEVKVLYEPGRGNR